MPRTLCSRRTYLRWMAGGLGALVTRHGWAGEPLPVRFPRATDGDDVSEPDWDDRLTVTVGNDHGDLAGDGDEVLQAALDYVARWGGGTVQCLPGTFTLRNAVFLPSHTRLRGSGAETVITKIASESQPLIADSDWYDQEITVAQAWSLPSGRRRRAPRQKRRPWRQRGHQTHDCGVLRQAA